MNRIIRASERLTAAIDLPGVLDSAYDAFEDVLAVLRHHQEDDEAAFAAFMFAACAAANGRDWIAWAPALPPASRRATLPMTCWRAPASLTWRSRLRRSASS